MEEEEEDDDDDVVITTERPEEEMQQQTHLEEDEEHDQSGQDQEQEQMNGQQNFGFDQNQNFSNMDFSNMQNFSPMMTMQSGMGMPNFGMGMPNMMGKYNRRSFNFWRSKLRGLQGMPGMNMDPSMMFGGGFGGMGGMNDMSMSMMNMGMGMNGMGNFGGMPGMGMGGGPGFFPPNGGGYNQQNFGSHMTQNFHHSRGYGRPYNRGFGRGGRGYYGRGRGGWQNYSQYHGQNQNQSYMNQQYQQQQNFRGNDESFDASAQQGATRGSPSYEPMNAPDGTASETGQQKRLTDAERAGDTNIAEVNATDETGKPAADTHDDGREESVPQLANEDVSKGKPRNIVIPSACAYGSARVCTHTETLCKEIANDSEVANDTEETATSGAPAERAVERGLQNESVNVDQPALYDQNNHDQQYQQGYGHGTRGRGGFRGARGGFRGRGGAYGYVSMPAEPEPSPAAAPPINAPTGPKAMRAGLPNSGWYSRPQQQATPAVAPQSEPEKPKYVEPEPRARTRSRSRSASRTRDHSDRKKPQDVEEESEDSYERRKDRDRRKRKERDGRDDEDMNGDVSSRKNRSRSESRDDDRSKRRHREKDDEHRSSRSHRERSRDRRRHRNRSRSAERDGSVNGEGYDSSRRKHKSDRRREDEYDESDRAKDRSRRRSRRDDDREPDGKDRSNESSRHARSSRDEREPEKIQSVVEPPEEEFEFKIKGKSASMKQGLDSSMAPPATFGRERTERRSSVQASTPVTPSTPVVDPYAADRENHRKKREAEQQKRMEGRRQSSQSLGKHSRDEDEFEAPTGPRGDSGRNGKRVRKDLRRHSLKYEGEVGEGYDERETRHWR